MDCAATAIFRQCFRGLFDVVVLQCMRQLIRRRSECGLPVSLSWGGLACFSEVGLTGSSFQ